MQYIENKKDCIYSSSQEAFWKMMVLVFSFGISIIASLFDDKSCYIAILVQAVNNIFDFYPMTDNRLYTKTIKNEALTISVCALIAIIYSILALLGLYQWMKHIIFKILGILLVSISIYVIVIDYRINIEKEDGELDD